MPRHLRISAFLVLLAVLVLGSFPAFAADEPAQAQELRGGLSVLDWIVVVLYAAGMLAVGFYYARRTKTTEDYYLGGRTMRPSMVGLSLFATLLSTITYLSLPGEMVKHGPVVLAGMLAVPVIYVVAGYFMIPHIMKLRITSAYEILETRLGRPVRVFGSVIFILIRLVWMGLVVYLSARIVIQAIGLDERHVITAVFVLGAVTVVYSAMGGLRAVVLTDVIQTVILFIGAVIAIAIVSAKMRGVGWFPTEWAGNWDKQPLFSFDPRVRATVLGAMINFALWWLCTAGSDQMAIQRYLATRDAKAARGAFLMNHVAGVVVQVVLALLGFALLGFFMANPQYLSESVNFDDKADYLFPYFVVNFMGFGMAGLVISGMLAAAMSSLSSGVNSVCTVVDKDIVEHFLNKSLSEEAKIRMAKWTSVAVGAIVIALGLVVGKVPGNIVEVTSKTNGLFVAPLFGLFFFAMFVPFATPYGAVFGSLYGFLAAFLVGFWDFTGGPGLSFQWILAVSLIVNIAVGCVLSLAPWRGRSGAHKVVLSTIAAIPLAAVSLWYLMACLRAAG
jgi:solute:Na+ symporter, SSS family